MRHYVRHHAGTGERGGASNDGQLLEPLQAWLPRFDPGLSNVATRRDLDRAQRAWNDETIVWLMPGLAGERRWKSPDCGWSTELAIPSETLNRIDVFHIGRNGFIFGLGWTTRFMESSVHSLLPDWLNAVNETGTDGVVLEAAPDTIGFILPIFGDRDEEVRYGLRGVRPPPGGTMPVVEVEREGEVALRWPPPNARLPRTVSPAAESREHLGKFIRRPQPDDAPEALPIAVHEEQPDRRSLHLLDRWPGSLENLLPCGGGLDFFLANARMRELAAASEADFERALTEASAEASCWQGTGEASFEHLRWHPRAVQHGVDEALGAADAQLCREFSSLAEAAKAPEFVALMKSREPVKTCHGVLGLLWTLFANHLRERARFVACRRCGRVVAARRATKRYCSDTDDRSCFRARRASDRRRLRA